ncbi:flagellar biosynthesis protein FlgG [Helicobacter pylori]|nr:flagellar biosynthesis protein FlgG [Helicobacter pylori]
MSVNLVGSAYRVTVPACVLVATLRKKLKAEQAKLKAEQEVNEKKMWYLAITFLIGLAVLAVFYMKRKHQSSNNPKSGVENLKNPSHKN